MLEKRYLNSNVKEYLMVASPNHETLKFKYPSNTKSQYTHFNKNLQKSRSNSRNRLIFESMKGTHNIEAQSLPNKQLRESSSTKNFNYDLMKY